MREKTWGGASLSSPRSRGLLRISPRPRINSWRQGATRLADHVFCFCFGVFWGFFVLYLISGGKKPILRCLLPQLGQGLG